MYQLTSYIKFLFKATNQHGVHSPFVYNFVTKCLYDRSKYKAYTHLHKYYTLLRSSKIKLKTTDFGEGSKVLDSNLRTVRRMVKVSSSSKNESKLLFRVSKYFKFNTILELGTSLGMGTYALALDNTSAKVTTVEGCKNTSKFTQLNLNNLGRKNIDFKIGAFSEIIPTLDTDYFDCIYFDGHHNKKATITYFQMLLPKAHNDSVFIFDDIYWSKDMTEAWEFIKTHKAVTVTIDCYTLGFVFFRKEQAKEHFKIRM